VAISLKRKLRLHPLVNWPQTGKFQHGLKFLALAVLLQPLFLRIQRIAVFLFLAGNGGKDWLS
jgi:hypothetical protein